jgi:hypothetical protein
VEAGARVSAGEMEERDHGQNDGQSRAGAEFVPMRGDKEDHAAGKQEGAENEGDDSLPANTGGMLLFGFPGANAIGDSRVENAGRLPAG